MIITDWQSRHGLDATAHQAVFDDLSGRGYRLVKITSYDAGGIPRYASVWHRQNGNPWRALHGVSEEKYQEAIVQWGAEGYRPIDLSVVRSGGVTRFSAIWEQEAGLQWRSWHGLTPEEYQSEFDRQIKSGFRLVRLVGYDSGFGPRYATIWEQSPGYPWRARHGLPEANYQAEFDAGVQDNMFLVDLSGFRNGGSVAFTTLWEQGEWAPERRGPVSDLVVPFMQKWAVPGLSLAVARDGVLRAAYCLGYANRITREIVTPDNRLRLASVAKPITSVAVHVLIEQGRLALTDLVFGPGKLLGTIFGTQPYSPRVLKITVQHLLEHSAGGWANDSADPMFQQLELSQADLISWTLDNVPLIWDPGTAYAYSNFGYCLLGRIIERVSGLSYGDFVRQFVLNPADASQMVLAGRSAAERAYPETMYFGVVPAAPYELRIDRMDAHGGWAGSPTEALRFLSRVDNRTPPPDLLPPATIAAMTTASAVNPALPGQPGYARGWLVNDVGTIWHDGTLQGTQAILVQVADGRQWCAACSAGRPNTALGKEFDELMWKVQAVVAAADRLKKLDDIVFSIEHDHLTGINIEDLVIFDLEEWLRPKFVPPISPETIFQNLASDYMRLARHELQLVDQFLREMGMSNDSTKRSAARERALVHAKQARDTYCLFYATITKLIVELSHIWAALQACERREQGTGTDSGDRIS